MAEILQQVRFAFRFIRRNPLFAAVTVCVLALGIGANSAMFSVVNAVLIRPIPYPDPDRVGIIWEKSSSQGWARINPSGPDFLDWKEQSKSFDDMALLEPGSGTLTGFGEPQQLPGMRVTTNFLRLIGAKPILGRDFAPGEGWQDRVVVLGYTAWQRIAGGDPSVIGRRVIADNLPYTIIGVLPPGVWTPVPSEVYVPWTEKDLRGQNRMEHRMAVVARLKQGVTWDQANAELETIQARIGDTFPRMKGWSAYALPLQKWLFANARPALLLLLGAVGLVLLIACTNLANLLLARAVTRSREVAIRTALGASRTTLIQQFLVEAVVLGILGGALGLLVALWGVGILDRVVPATIRMPDSNTYLPRPQLVIDGTVLAFTVVVSIVTGILFGLAPALAAARTDVHDTLKEGSRGSSTSSRTLWVRNGLVISQVALALVLLVAASMAIQSIWNMQRVDAGFSADHLLVMETELPTDAKYKTDPEMALFYKRAVANLQAIPGVQAAAISCSIPLDEEDHKADFQIEGRPLPSSGQLPAANYRAVSEDYFSALRIPLKKGRLLAEDDDADHRRVALIDEEMANRYWPQGVQGPQDPIGQKLRIGRESFEIVGIVGTVHNAGMDKKAEPTIYVDFRQEPENHVRIVLRHGNPSSIVNAAKQAIYAVDKDQPVFNIRTMDELVAGSQRSSRFASTVLAIFAGLALLLACVGIYGVVSYSVTQRKNEIGIRLALGAGPQEVIRMIVFQGANLALFGIAIGLVAALAITRVLSSLLFGVSPADPAILGSTAVALAAVAVLASFLPARRASRIDPAVSLRCE